MNKLLKKIAKLEERVQKKVFPKKFKSSNTYWKERYKTGGNSGSGSYNHLSEFKAKILNDFIEK